MQIPNFKYLIDREFGLAGAFSFCDYVGLSPLGDHVVNIIPHGSSEEMNWPKTQTVITVMADKHAFRYLPVGNYVRHSMGTEFSDFPGQHASVAVSRYPAIPFKTRIFAPVARWVVIQPIKAALQVVEIAQSVGILVRHLSALLWRGCTAVSLFAQRPAISILPLNTL